MNTIKDINSAIMFGDFTNEQLNSIISAVTFARAQLACQNKNTYSVGTEVKFTSSRTGQTMIGLVQKVNRKNMLIQVGSRLWKVPASMLQSV
jgi:hypothetical protein